jgi:molecular chaperone DnaK
MKPIYGIDLGTTYTKCGLVRPEDRVLKIFELDSDSASSSQNTLKILRSAVSICREAGSCTAYVGNRSWSHFADHDPETDPPYRRFEESKLWIGEAQSGEVDEPPWEFDGWQYRPEDIGALVLRKVKREVEAARGPPMEQIVITHPQNFSESKRESTRQAAAVAGLHVVDTLTEPDAAAIAYRGARMDGTYMVFDLGGGTLDITIAKITPTRTEVLTSEGIRQGGRDWDRALYMRMGEFYHEKFPDFSLEIIDDPTRQEWLQKAEQLKWQLCASDVAPDGMRGTKIVCRNATFEGMPAHFKIKRAEFDALTQPLVADCQRCAEAALAHKHLKWTDLAGILLVGGSTHMPAIRTMLAGLAGAQLLNTNIDPSLAVAQGAALHAFELSQRGPRAISTPPVEKVSPPPKPSRSKQDKKQAEPAAGEQAASIALRATHTGALARGLGVRAWDPSTRQNVVANMIPKDSPIPISHEQTFVTTKADQTSLDVELWEGESSELALCEKIGVCALTNIPKGPAGQKVNVTIRIDANGSKHIIVTASGVHKEELIRFDEERVLSTQSLAERQAFIQGVEIR